MMSRSAPAESCGASRTPPDWEKPGAKSEFVPGERPSVGTGPSPTESQPGRLAFGCVGCMVGVLRSPFLPSCLPSLLPSFLACLFSFFRSSFLY